MGWCNSACGAKIWKQGVKVNPSLPARMNPSEASAGLFPKRAGRTGKEGKSPSCFKDPVGIRILPGTSSWLFEGGPSPQPGHREFKRQGETSPACFAVLPGCVSGNRIVIITILIASGKQGGI